MRSRIGSTILLGLLYSQAFFGLAAVAAVAVSDDVSRQAATVSSGAAALSSPAA